MLLEQVLTWWRRLVIFMQAMNLLYWAMCTAWYCCTATTIKMISKVDMLCIVVLFAVTLAAAGAIRAISLPMVAFTGFYESPGPPPSGNVHGIAPSHCHCYQNGQRRRYICSLLLPLLFDQNVAKRPCYGPFKLIPSYYINQSNRCY